MVGYLKKKLFDQYAEAFVADISPAARRGNLKRIGAAVKRQQQITDTLPADTSAPVGKLSGKDRAALAAFMRGGL